MLHLKCAKADTVDLGAGFQFGGLSCGRSPNSKALEVSQVVAGAAKRRSIPESSDDYDKVVAVLNDRWRVVRCRDGIQWIIQYRASAETYLTADWRGRSYCRTSEALRRCSIALAGEIGAEATTILAGLPVSISRGAN